MKTTRNGKRYDSEKMEELACVSRHNNGNLSGSDSLQRASDGTYWLMRTSNGQDLYRGDSITICDDPAAEIEEEGLNIDEDQEKRLVELGVLEVVP